VATSKSATAWTLGKLIKVAALIRGTPKSSAAGLRDHPKIADPEKLANSSIFAGILGSDESPPFFVLPFVLNDPLHKSDGIASEDHLLYSTLAAQSRYMYAVFARCGSCGTFVLAATQPLRKGSFFAYVPVLLMHVMMYLVEG
jgi:hypothetical protein